MARHHELHVVELKAGHRSRKQGEEVRVAGTASIQPLKRTRAQVGILQGGRDDGPVDDGSVDGCGGPNGVELLHDELRSTRLGKALMDDGHPLGDGHELTARTGSLSRYRA